MSDIIMLEMCYVLDDIYKIKNAFHRARLIRSSFQCAILRNTDFSHAELYEVDFSFADLSGSDFRGAKLRRANLTGANLSNVMTDSHTEWVDATLTDTVLYGNSLDGKGITDKQIAQLKSSGFADSYAKNCPWAVDEENK